MEIRNGLKWYDSLLEYHNSNEWYYLKDLFNKHYRFNNRCFNCDISNAEMILIYHHIRNRYPFINSKWYDLMKLCVPCHDEIHKYNVVTDLTKKYTNQEYIKWFNLKMKNYNNRKRFYFLKRKL